MLENSAIRPALTSNVSRVKFGEGAEFGKATMFTSPNSEMDIPQSTSPTIPNAAPMIAPFRIIGRKVGGHTERRSSLMPSMTKPDSIKAEFQHQKVY